MANLRRADFDNWRQDSVTKAFYLAMIDRVEEAKEVLSNQAGFNAVEDSYYRGFIRAYREALEFRIDDLTEDLQ